MTADLLQTADPDRIIAEIAAAARVDRNRAIELAISAFGRGVKDPFVMRLVAEGLEEDGRPQDAGNLLLEAKKLAPRDVEILSQFGRLLANLGRPAEALEAQREALAIDPATIRLMRARAAPAWIWATAPRRAPIFSGPMSLPRTSPDHCPHWR